MSWLDISPAAVLAQIQAGTTARADLAAHFGVLSSSAFLRDAIEELVVDGRVYDRGTHLEPHYSQPALTDIDDLEEQ